MPSHEAILGDRLLRLRDHRLHQGVLLDAARDQVSPCLTAYSLLLAILLSGFAECKCRLDFWIGFLLE